MYEDMRLMTVRLEDLGQAQANTQMDDYVTKSNLISVLEDKLAERSMFQVTNRWKFIQGNNSKDFYIKDCELKGYYRLSTTDKKVNLDACLIQNNNTDNQS